MYDLVILRTPDRIGDYTLWHDAIPEYKKKYDGKKILLITVKDLLPLMQEECIFNDIITYDHNRLIHDIRYLFSFLRRIRKVEAGVTIYPFRTRNIVGDIFVSCIRSKEKIGLKYVREKGLSFRNLCNQFFNHCYTRLIDTNNVIHEIEAIELFTREVVNPNYRYGYNRFVLNETDKFSKKKYAVIALSASQKQKIWSVYSFASIINEIPDEYDIVLSGYGHEDEERATIVCENVNNKDRIVSMVGKTTILQLVSLIAHSCFVVGNDSSAVHIAAATCVPSICVLHGAHFNRFVPYPQHLPFQKYYPRAVYFKMDCYWCGYNCKKPIIDETYECLRRVTVDMVKIELNKLLDEINNGIFDE